MARKISQAAGDSSDARQRANALLRLKQAQLMLKSGKEQLIAAQLQIDEAQKLIDQSAEVLRTIPPWNQQDG